MASDRPARALNAVQIVSLGVALAVGVIALSARLSVAGPRALPGASSGATTRALVNAIPDAALADAGLALNADANTNESASVRVSASTDAAVDVVRVTDASAASAPIDYATVQTERDFPEGLSYEQRLEIGTGLVPIHREGPYRSPFAHPRFGGPAHVAVGLVLATVREFDIQHGRFSADFFLSLTSADKAMPVMSPSFSNGQDVTMIALADTPTFKLWRVQGTFATDIDLRAYPWDTQQLRIEVEDRTAGADQVVFDTSPNRTALDEGFEVPGWSVSSLGAHVYKHAYPARFDRDDLYVSRYVFVLGLARFGTSAAFSVYVPALIIVLISLTGLWVPFNLVDVRSNAGAPMLAAAVLFHYSLIQSLPATGYLTRADKLMLGTYLSLLLNMLSTWAFFIVREHNRDRVFELGKRVIPLLTIAVMTLAIVL